MYVYFGIRVNMQEKPVLSYVSSDPGKRNRLAELAVDLAIIVSLNLVEILIAHFG